MEDQPKCLLCGTTSDQRVLISCIKENGDAWVCVGCLPTLIHGVHG